MKIAVSAEGPDLDANVGHRLGTSRYLLIVDLATMKSEAVALPGVAHQGSGMQAVVLAISRKVDVVLTGWCSPQARAHLEGQGIDVQDGLTGKVTEVVEGFRRAKGIHPLRDAQDKSHLNLSASMRFKIGIKATARQFGTILPIVTGVIFILGMFIALVPKNSVAGIFSGNLTLDAFLGACTGSLFAGNPINSYIIGGKLLDQGIGLVAVTAFMVSWVSVGLVQLPAEMASFGRRFALVRNGLSFLFSMVIAVLTVLTMDSIFK